MPMIQERMNKLGNVLKFEAHANVNLTREEVIVTTPADAGYADTTPAPTQLQVGAVLELVAGKYVPLVNADPSAKTLAILIDDRIEELAPAPLVADVKVAVMVNIKAPVILRQGGLLFNKSVTEANRALAYARLDALGFKIASTYSTL